MKNGVHLKGKEPSDFYCGVGPNNISTNTRAKAENLAYAELLLLNLISEVHP